MTDWNFCPFICITILVSNYFINQLISEKTTYHTECHNLLLVMFTINCWPNCLCINSQCTTSSEMAKLPRSSAVSATAEKGDRHMKKGQLRPLWKWCSNLKLQTTIGLWAFSKLMLTVWWRSPSRVGSTPSPSSSSFSTSSSIASSPPPSSCSPSPLASELLEAGMGEDLEKDEYFLENIFSRQKCHGFGGTYHSSGRQICGGD